MQKKQSHNESLKELIKYTIFSSALMALQGNYDLEAPSLNLHHVVWRILNLKTRLGQHFSLYTFTIQLRMDQVGLIYMLWSYHSIIKVHM